jgi:hypothetical protein
MIIFMRKKQYSFFGLSFSMYKNCLFWHLFHIFYVIKNPDLPAFFLILVPYDIATLLSNFAISSVYSPFVSQSELLK